MDGSNVPCVIIFYGIIRKEGKIILALNVTRVLGTIVK